MYKNALFACLLIAFIYVQLADSLMCKTCIAPADCKKPELKSCNNVEANATAHQLTAIFDNVPLVNGSLHFECLKLTHVSNATNVVVKQLYGCLHPAIKPCNLHLKQMYLDLHWRRTECFVSPAGTFSTSPYLIIPIFGVLLAKLYA